MHRFFYKILVIFFSQWNKTDTFFLLLYHYGAINILLLYSSCFGFQVQMHLFQACQNVFLHKIAFPTVQDCTLEKSESRSFLIEVICAFFSLLMWHICMVFCVAKFVQKRYQFSPSKFGLFNRKRYILFLSFCILMNLWIVNTKQHWKTLRKSHCKLQN